MHRWVKPLGKRYDRCVRPKYTQCNARPTIKIAVSEWLLWLRNKPMRCSCWKRMGYAGRSRVRKIAIASVKSIVMHFKPPRQGGHRQAQWQDSTARIVSPSYSAVTPLPNRRAQIRRRARHGTRWSRAMVRAAFVGAKPFY